MTRILALSLRYPPHHEGGYALSTRDVLEELARRGHQVEVLASGLRVPGVPDPAAERTGNPAVRRDLQAYLQDGALQRPAPWRRWTVERHNHAVLGEALARFRPDVVAPWQMSALSMGLLTAVADAAIPMVYAVSDDWLSYGPELDAWSHLFARRPRLGRLVARLAGVPTALPDVGATGRFLFNSEVMRVRSERYSPWTFPDHDVVHVALDTRRYPITDHDAPRPWRGRLLYAGRLDPRKGVETAVRAMAELEGAELEIRGTGDDGYGQRLVSLAIELGVADRIALEPPRQDGLADRYRAADAVVFPSEWEEPFGLVPVEAMACGTPVVATGVGGSAEYLEHERNCLLFPPGDAAALAAAVRRLRDDPGLRAGLVRAGTETARRFALGPITDRFERHYTELAGA